MTYVALFVAATKLAGILATVTVAANAFSFSRYRKKNLKPFLSPIDESSDTLALFNVNPSDGNPTLLNSVTNKYEIKEFTFTFIAS